MFSFLRCCATKEVEHDVIVVPEPFDVGISPDDPALPAEDRCGDVDSGSEELDKEVTTEAPSGGEEPSIEKPSDGGAPAETPGGEGAPSEVPGDGKASTKAACGGGPSGETPGDQRAACGGGPSGETPGDQRAACGGGPSGEIPGDQKASDDLPGEGPSTEMRGDEQATTEPPSGEACDREHAQLPPPSCRRHQHAARPAAAAIGMLEQDVDTTLKVIVVGNGRVGKTAMITRFAKGIFTNEYKKTIGVDFLEKKLYLNSCGEEVTFLLWDTAGQEEYDAITRTYYKGAGACILAFSTTDRASFTAIESWKQKVQDECGNITTVLVQNKVDLMDSAVIDPKEVEYLAKQLRLKLYRTCVKDDLNVAEVFQHLGEEFVRSGGQAALGSTGITPLEDVASKPMAEAAGAQGSSGASSSQQAAQPAADPQQAFKLSSGARQPSVQRTGGKKHKVSCSIL